ncbi:MAG: hypothetical protein R2939_04540 [Kofleriaceae bacterium]
MRHQLLSLLVSAGSLAGCTLVDLEVEVRRACATQPPVAIEGFPETHGALEHELVFDSEALLAQFAALDAEVEFAGASVRAAGPATGLAFVEAASLEVASDDPAVAAVELHACDGDCAQADGALELAPSAALDLLAYAEAGPMTFNLGLVGSLPHEAWTMEVDVCLAAQVHYALGTSDVR